jgi:prevent-host-death family protein
MRSVGSRELKTRLGTYLGQVRRGAALVVTDRGQPVAELRPIAAAGSREDVALARLAALGVVALGNGSRPGHFRPIRSAGKPAAEAVIEGREDRF